MQHIAVNKVDVFRNNDIVDGVESSDKEGSENTESHLSDYEAGLPSYDKSSNMQSDNFIESIEDITWFHKGMTRNASEAILLTNASEGTYLLRDSIGNPGNYTISVRYSNSVKHFSVTHSDGVYKFGIGEFESLNEFLNHFDCLPVLGTETGGTVTLRYPYFNNIPEPNTYEKIVRHAEGSRAMSFKSVAHLSPDLHIASKEGYLVKRGAIRKSWKKRWFTLQKNELKYFKLKGASKPIRTLNLEDAVNVRDDDTMQKLNCFALVFPQRTFYLYASSSREAGDWIRILKWKLNYFDKRKHPEIVADPLASVAR